MDKETSSLTGDTPLCTVCIANYNGKYVLKACLDSVFCQDFPYPVEVIVHDDASTDGSSDIVSEQFPSVRLIRSDSNVGFCISNNRMVAAARGRFILLLNNDATLRKDALATLYACATDENVDGIIGLPQYDMETGKLLDRGSLFDPFLNPVPNLDKNRRHVGMVIGACMWMPKTLWDELGGFPEWFESIAEDMYICCRARLKGYPVIVLPDSGFDHKVGSSLGGGKVKDKTLQTTYRRRALSERNKSYVMIMCYPSPHAFAFIPLHLLLLAIEGLALAALKKDRHIWRNIYQTCLCALWNMRKILLECRRKIQKEKVVSVKYFYSFQVLVPYKLKMLLRYRLPVIK